MLSSIRHTTASWVAKLLFVLLIFAFGAWGVGDIFRGGGKSAAVAKVGDLEYSETDYARDLQRMLQTYQQRYGQITMQQLKAFGLARQVLENNINDRLIQIYAKQLGVIVPTSLVQQDIQATPQFRGLDGKFSRQTFLQVLSQNGYDEANYFARSRQTLQTRMVFRALFGAITVPPQLTTQIFGYQNESRAGDLLVIPAASITNIPQPDDAALTEFHKNHSKNYMRPEYRAATILQLSPSDFMKDVQVSDDDVAKDYDAHKAQYSTPETRDLEQVVVQDPALADKILAAMQGGKTFSAAVKDASGGNVVDLGTVTKDQLQPKELQDPAFALATDTVSKPIKSPYGVHLIHVKSIVPGVTQTLDQVKDPIRNNLALGKASDSLVKVLNQLDDALGGGGSVADAAQKLGLQAKTIDAIDSLGTDKSGKDVGVRAEIVGLIQQTSSGSTSQVVPFQDGSYAVVQVTGVTPSDVKPLAEVKDQVVKDWTADQQLKAATEQAKQLLAKLRAGTSLADAAKGLNLTIKHSDAFTRLNGDPDAGITPDLAAKLFTAKVGDYVDGAATDGAAIAQLTGITPALADDHKDAAKELGTKLQQDLNQELVTQFSAALQQQIPVTRNEELINKVLSQE